MTTLMRTLIERLRELPEEQQDKYAATYLKELEADQRWEELFLIKPQKNSGRRWGKRSGGKGGKRRPFRLIHF